MFTTALALMLEATPKIVDVIDVVQSVFIEPQETLLASYDITHVGTLKNETGKDSDASGLDLYRAPSDEPIVTVGEVFLTVL